MIQWPSQPHVARRWYSAYEQNDPIVKMIVECEADICLQVNCRDDHSLEILKKLDQKSPLNFIARGICREGLIAGTALPFLRINCPRCVGSLSDPLYPHCDHEGSEISSIEILDHSMIHEEAGTFFLIPNSELQHIVLKRRPQEVYEKLAPFVRTLVREGKMIPINTHCISKIEAPSLVRNIMDGCPNTVAAALADTWRTKVHEWVSDVLMKKICKMRNLKVPEVLLVEPCVRTLQKYSAIDLEVSWQDLRKKLNIV